jgi:hypothetical protein
VQLDRARPRRRIEQARTKGPNLVPKVPILTPDLVKLQNVEIRCAQLHTGEAMQRIAGSALQCTYLSQILPFLAVQDFPTHASFLT